MGGGNTKQRSPAAAGLSLRHDERWMLGKCLHSLPFPPGTVNAEIVAAAAAHVERVDYAEPVNVLVKGERAKGIFILVKGHAQVMLTTDDPVADLRPGSFFGELSSLFYVPVTATVKSTTPAQFLLLKEESLRKAVGEVVSTDLMEYYVKQRYFDTSGKLDQSSLLHRIAVSAITALPLFGGWGKETLDGLMQQAREDLTIPYLVMVVPDRAMLVLEEDKAEEIVVVTRGIVEVTREKEVIATLDSLDWPIWIGEEGLFSSVDNLCSVRASGTCQAFRIKKSTIKNTTSNHESEASRAFAKREEAWRSRVNHQRQLSPRLQAELYLPVIIYTLERLEMFSQVDLPFLYDIAMLGNTKVYTPNDIIVDGTGKPAKIRKALQARASRKQNGARGSDVQSIATGQAGGVVAENDMFLLPLRGEIVVGGVEEVVFKQKNIIYIPHMQLKEIKLIAKGETLVLSIEGNRLLNLCNTYPAMNLKIPRPVL